MLGLSGCVDASESTTTSSAPTKDDYYQAVLDTVACIEEAGLSSSALEQPDGSYAISITSPNRGSAVDANMDEVYDRCREEHLNEISSAYLASISPTFEEAQEIMMDCLVDLGIVEPTAPPEEVETIIMSSGHEDPELEQAIANCLSKPYLQPPAGQ